MHARTPPRRRQSASISVLATVCENDGGSWDSHIVPMIYIGCVQIVCLDCWLFCVRVRVCVCTPGITLVCVVSSAHTEASPHGNMSEVYSAAGENPNRRRCPSLDLNGCICTRKRAIYDLHTHTAWHACIGLCIFGHNENSKLSYRKFINGFMCSLLLYEK